MLFSSLSGVGKLHVYVTFHIYLHIAILPTVRGTKHMFNIFCILRLYMQAYIYTGFDEYSQIL